MVRRIRLVPFQVPGQALSTVTARASNSAERTARIAGVLTLFSDRNAPHVKWERMLYGLNLAQFYLSEAQCLTDAAIIPQDIQRGKTLRFWLLEH